MAAHICDSLTQNVEAGMLMQGQESHHKFKTSLVYKVSKFHASQGYINRPCLKVSNKRKKKECALASDYTDLLNRLLTSCRFSCGITEFHPKRKFSVGDFAKANVEHSQFCKTNSGKSRRSQVSN